MLTTKYILVMSNTKPTMSQSGPKIINRFTTPTSHMLTFFPDSQTDYNYFAPNQSQEDHRAQYSNVILTPLDWGQNLDLNLFNHQPPPN
ncbi:hypothetical protein HanRHA438_Chr08g0335041 [Helianthus annuus]|uniref:Uncharacterized protein n=1 Tax=Helianthus annuus TaxID=4232 RepID=A0A9K3IBU3_HELAN|nr:hypothetical protein HanXRQr2_Chr08g0323881 [Helianthus annuus]KAJ0552364.1 hypothetical protein HanHA89_Chr08g0284451 [Helianthus annuus]KAJ0896471.1 hypothetical protein HanRHA438_Chr08g0335041 [Helianthus annuus]